MDPIEPREGPKNICEEAGCQEDKNLPSQGSQKDKNDKTLCEVLQVPSARAQTGMAEEQEESSPKEEVIVNVSDNHPKVSSSSVSGTQNQWSTTAKEPANTQGCPASPFKSPPESSDLSPQQGRLHFRHQEVPHGRLREL